MSQFDFYTRWIAWFESNQVESWTFANLFSVNTLLAVFFLNLSQNDSWWVDLNLCMTNHAIHAELSHIIATTPPPPPPAPPHCVAFFLFFSKSLANRLPVVNLSTYVDESTQFGCDGQPSLCPRIGIVFALTSRHHPGFGVPQFWWRVIDIYLSSLHLGNIHQYSPPFWWKTVSYYYLYMYYKNFNLIDVLVCLLQVLITECNETALQVAGDETSLYLEGNNFVVFCD